MVFETSVIFNKFVRRKLRSEELHNLHPQSRITEGGYVMFTEEVRLVEIFLIERTYGMTW
jgi:hypothetical protein